MHGIDDEVPVPISSDRERPSDGGEGGGDGCTGGGVDGSREGGGGESDTQQPVQSQPEPSSSLQRSMP